MIDREKQLYLWANPKQNIGEGFIHFEFGICSPTGSTTGNTSGVTVDLNNQWVESAKKLDGYLVFMSNSNKGVANGYASMKFKFKGEPDFKIWINSYAGYDDYTIAFNLDVDYPTSNPSISSKGVKAHTQFSFGSIETIDDFKEVDYPNDGGEHFVVVTYRKDGSENLYDDRGYVAVKLKPLSTSWVISSTEFIKDNGKYYQRLNEIGTYEGGFTGTTGNFKKGNELTPTYKQSDAIDFMIVGSKMYYKKYAWVTPVDTAINTGDYIQGDYIGEATLSTKVTYTDGTTKEFNISGEITSGSVDNISAATKVDIGINVTSIGGYAFANCKNLSAVTLPISVKAIKYSAFRNCTNINSFIVPISVKKIGDNAFNGCTKLNSISISDNVKQIDDNAFTNCSNLKSAIIGNGITRLGSLFVNCTSLQSFTIPSSVTEISGSFTNCTSLQSFTIPSSVVLIDYNSFSGCKNLSLVTIENSSNKLEYRFGAFSDISSTAKLYVPSNLLADYQADTDWTGAFPGGIYAIE